MEFLEIVLNFGAIAVLLVFSSIFSCSETAITASSLAKIHRLAESGSKQAVIAAKLLEKSQYLVSSILLGNNLVNILATSIATAMFVGLIGDGGVALATVFMTFMVLIFSETLPKTYAIMNPEGAALKVSRFVRFFCFVLSPFAYSLNRIVFWIMFLFRVKTDKLSPGSGVLKAKDELRDIISFHHSKGSFVKNDHDMLLGALDLNDREVKDVMRHRRDIFMLDINSDVEDIVNTCIRSPYSRVPLYDGNKENIVGVLHVKDLLCAVTKLVRGPGKTSVDLSDLNILEVAREPSFVPDTKSLSNQLASFLRRRSHFTLVVDEYGVLQGLITLEDILEEIVGEINDEYDPNCNGITKEQEGSFLIPGSMAIRDVQRHLGWKLPDDDATTVAGLVIHEAQCIPDVGQIFVFHKLRFEIVERKLHQITLLRVRPPPKTVKDDD